MNHNKLKDYLAAEKLKCEKETEGAHARSDFSGMQYWIGRKHALVDFRARFWLDFDKEDSKHENS